MFAMYRLLAFIFLTIFSGIPLSHSFAQESVPTNTPLPEIARTTTPTQAQPTITPMGNLVKQLRILSPVNGQIIQGITPIQVFTNFSEIRSMELAYAYSTNPTDTWFTIPLRDSLITDGVIAEWDTSTISDGNYDLLLTANLVDGNKVTAKVELLRVRNYSAIETNTPTPVTPTSEAEIANNPTPIPTNTAVAATKTPFPENPASLSTIELAYNLGKGALVTAGIFALIGMYSIIKKTYPR